MINKLVLQSIINKYYLGINESVKWSISDNKLEIHFMTPSRDVIGYVKYNNFPIENNQLVVYDTKKLLNLINICSGDLILELDTTNKIPTKLHISDSNFNLIYALADPLLITKTGEVNTPSWDIEIDLELEHINNLIKAKSALSEIDNMSIITSMNMDGDEICEFIFGDEKGHNNKIIYQIAGKIMTSGINLPFNSDIFKTILQANKDVKNGKLYLSKLGLMKLEFIDEDIISGYFLVRKSEQNF